MTQIQQTGVWRYLVSEPWLWLSSCFFQPVSFSEKTEMMLFKQRLMASLRMNFVILLFTYPGALFFRTLLCILNVNLYPDYFTHNFSLFDSGVLNFYYDGTWAAVLACIIAGLVGAFFSLRLVIAAAFAVSLAAGINNGNNDYTIVGIVFGLSLGFIVGPIFNNIKVIRKDGLANVILGNITAVLAGLITGTAVGTVGSFWGGVAVVYIAGKALQDADSILGSMAGMLIGGIGSCLVFTLLCLPVYTISRSKRDTIDLSIRIGTAVAGALGVAVGTTTGDMGLISGNSGFASGITEGITQGLTVGSAFLLLYLLSYYRLPLYPISAFSMIRTYLRTRRNAGEVFVYLQGSSLHYDECVFLPLPFLTRILRIAITQDLSLTLQEIEYIVLERPQQRHAAQAAAYEIVLDDLSERQVLTAVSQAYQRLPELLSPRVRNLNVAVAKLFSSLEDVSWDAASYWRHNKIGNSGRDSYDALQRMLVRLNAINSHAAFKNGRLNRQLEEIIKRWQLLAQQAQETLNIDVSASSVITNPYIAGPTLLPIDEMPNPVFVGRDDVVKKLNTALQRTPHPTFCLTGERRMGKSSILKQLPVLLGSRYLPIFYDLHNPALHSDIMAFFIGLAEGIEEQLFAKHIFDVRLARNLLDDARQENEVAVYTVFDNWLKRVEQALREHDRVLLLMFDEFEKLDIFQQKGLLDLDLLLSWFRSVSQNSTHIMFLFCGVKTVYEMGSHWTRHFVNVERVKVSFLPSTSARNLVTRPVSAHSTQYILGNEIVEDIIHVTRSHPFLLQALCSRLIDNLNDASREQANREDIAIAIEEIFENWREYFWDQWQRSSEEQKCCMLTLHVLGKGNSAQIIRQSKVSEHLVYQALDQLRERDIVKKENQFYQFTVPLFAMWIAEQYNLLRSPQ